MKQIFQFLIKNFYLFGVSQLVFMYTNLFLVRRLIFNVKIKVNFKRCEKISVILPLMRQKQTNPESLISQPTAKAYNTHTHTHTHTSEGHMINKRIFFKQAK